MKVAVLAVSSLTSGAFAINPCKTAGDFTANSNSCQALADSFTTFTPSTNTCKDKVAWQSNTLTRATHMQSLADKCCGTDGYKKHICIDHITTVCKTPSMFNGKADPGMGGALCIMIASENLAPFTASATTCVQSVNFGGQSMTRGAALSKLSKCCGSTPSVCAEHVGMNPCKTSGDFVPTADPNMGGQNCKVMADLYTKFTPGLATCTAKVTWAGNTNTRHLHMSMLAAKCCGSSKADICQDHLVQICKDKSKFVPSADAGLGGAKCGAVVSDFTDFTASATTCTAEITMGTSKMSRGAAINKISTGCCGGTTNVCEAYVGMNPCKDTAKFTPTVDPKMGGQNCKFMSDTFTKFTADATTCKAKVTWLSNSHSRATHMMMLADKCCGTDGAKSFVCSDKILQVCVDPKQFNGKADAGVGGANCLSVVTQNMASFTATQATCDEKISFGGSTITRIQALNKIASGCCTNTAHVCKKFEKAITAASGMRVQAAVSGLLLSMLLHIGA